MAAPAPPVARPAPPSATTYSNRSQVRRNTLLGWSFILPNFAGFALLTLVPVVATFGIAFTKWNAYSTPEFTGLDNFTRLVQDGNFRVALFNTVYYTVGHVPLTMAASLLLALALNRKLRGVAFFRTAAFFPYITSIVAVAVVWNMLYNPTQGPINQFLLTLGLEDPPGWTSDPSWAMPAVILTGVWKDMGYYMILFLAGLQTIPPELHEAAKVDGANAFQRFRNVTLPCLRPTTFFVLIMLTIGSFKVFDLIVVMTDGGPGRSTLVLSQLIYREGIVNGRFGYSSAVALALFLLVLAVTVAQYTRNKRLES
ncbi:sugar ABC transporter permease [Paenibacillus sp. TRM 82003]|uniref:carbohydrate ABC transporter permease n=1 Tax=Kineococcus sp. TRM81007 TaxID=2925831 RepID=UPI001F588295|nr:sugar ABC transporter permease [Kineococcus sp. TRM81007]MCI2237296.1 sugar ABC transporter permease [Kineococcus sp. TRM81007]MCI3919355.1 sugar ABC transporter permease [Paenibacillus sp. TRM 82003]